MGMTIEQAKAMLSSYLHGSTGYTGSLRDAIDTVLPIVEKYQKIQEIATTLEWEKEVSYQSVIAMMNIREVLEDGN